MASDGKVIPGGPSTGWRDEGVFYQIDRIATILIGSQRRCLLLCWPMSKVSEEEVYLAPYEVYTRNTRGKMVALSLRAIYGDNIHFVELLCSRLQLIDECGDLLGDITSLHLS